MAARYNRKMGFDLPSGWRTALAAELAAPYVRELEAFVEAERAEHMVYPPADQVFAALAMTPLAQVRVVLIGQDPYHGEGQAHGLAFSVRPGVKTPPSLRNMFKELKEDLGCEPPNHGRLEHWANQGVLLLNAVLTVRAKSAGSHARRGWETFTDGVVRAVNEREQPAVFLLWGGYAQKKGKHIDTARHRVITGAHPSPLSAKKFFGSRPFSAVNAALAELGQPEIDWCVPDR